jgi:hypothetical protein
MDNLGIRTLTSQLADDFSWLEDHSRRSTKQEAQGAQLRLAAALVRNCIGPYLDGQPARPLHVAVVGGAGAGKSTVANLLSGSQLAEANPQAGFTRHPIAYAGANGAISWPAHLGFLGPLQRLTRASPSSLDADVYQVRQVPQDVNVYSLLPNFVVWDCPDMTTWAATGYVPRLLEVAALADVLVYVASDERYNDEVPTQFLQMLLQAGKVVIVCLVKMRETDAPAFVAHFRQEVLSRMPQGVLGVLPIPQLTREQLADPVHKAAAYRIPLVNQIAVLGDPPERARQHAVRSALGYLLRSQDQLLSVARNDLTALQGWRDVVQQGQIEFDTRYRREYLTTEKFHRFDQALVRLLELLELPGIGKVLSTTLWVLRTPYRLLKGLFNKAMSRPEQASLPERTVLEHAANGWIDQLRKEAAHRAATHSVWAHIHQGFQSGLADLAKDRFEQGVRGFQLGLADEVERTARAIYEELEKNPAKLNAMRSGKFILEVGSILGVIGVTVTTGVPFLLDMILIPLAASISHQLVELLGQQYVDNQRELTRHRQQALVTQYISSPLAEWLAQWPTTGGSAYERLQLALKRIPPALAQLDDALKLKLARDHSANGDRK